MSSLLDSYGCMLARKLPGVALAAIVVAVVSALISAGTLLYNILSFRRAGWDLNVDAWWDFRDKQVHVAITNVGRQACVISEIRYFISDQTDYVNEGLGPFGGFAAMLREQSVRDYDAVPKPVAPSAKVEVTKDLSLPKVFTLEVWVWTGDRPYKSQKLTQDVRDLLL